MFRKPYKPAPFFGMPGAPFNPVTGERAQLGPLPPRGTTLALFQVVEDDTHDNYVVCRGYEAESDPEFRFLHDPYTVPTTTPINVAKPYAVRGTFPYEKGDVIVAARIKGKLGYNPGKAVTVGQPADLDEVISLLTDDDGKSISWMELSSPQPAWVGGTFLIYPTNLSIDVAVGSSISPGNSGSGAVAWALQNVAPTLEPFTDDLEAGAYLTFGGIKFNTPGIYAWRFYSTLTSSTGLQGAVLRIRSYLDGTALSPYCYRTLQIEINNVGAEIQRSVENVAMSGQTKVTAGQVLNFRNDSPSSIITVGGALCELTKVG